MARAMAMVSYAQNAEDVVLDRVFGSQAHGIYIDVGASDPVRDSVTKHFYDRGWSGVNIEPLAIEFRALVEQRPRDTNLNIALGSRRETRTFYEAVDNPSLSTFTPERAEEARAISAIVARELEVVPIASIIDEYLGDRTIDFLKVDAEGFEPEVLEGNDWSRHRPRVLVIETDVWRVEAPLVDANYRFTLFDGINSFWVRGEDGEELAPALSFPAVLVRDDYRPWHLHFFAREAVERVIGAHVDEHSGDASAAVRELAEVYCLRPDLQAAFGMPANLRVGELLGWSAWACRGADPSADVLAPSSVVFRRLAAAELPRCFRLRRIVRGVSRRVARRLAAESSR
jgi:FkbM family methyltransferase